MLSERVLKGNVCFYIYIFKDMKMPKGTNVKVILFHMVGPSNKQSFSFGEVLFIPVIYSHTKLIDYS